MILRWFVIITCCLSQQAISQTIPVRTGEHGDFTRLVVQLPVGSTWNLNQQGRSAKLQIDSPTVQFNLSNSFTRINRNRIKDLSQEEAGRSLDIELNCDCSIDAKNEGGRLVVVDIRNGKDQIEQLNLPRLTYDSRAYRFQLPENEKPIGAGEAGQEQISRNASPTLQRSNVISQKSDDANKKIPLSAGLSARQPVLLPSVADLDQMAIFERSVNARLTRATRQGLLTSNQINSVEPGVTEKSTTDNDEEENIPGKATNVKEIRPGLSVTTSIDRDLAELSKSTKGLPRPIVRQCPRTLMFLNEFSDDQTEFSTVIAALRAELVTELDDIRDEKLLELAKAYLGYGFGAESKHSLELIAKQGKDFDLLYAIAEISDGLIVKENPFHNLRKCDDMFAFWDFAARQEEREEIDTEAVLRGFLGLPLDLRENLGPRIGQAFLKNGKIGAAASVVRATRRVQENHSPELLMTEAALARDKGSLEASQQALEEVVESGSDQSPLALVELVEQRLKSRKGVSDEDVGLFESYLHEYRDTDQVSALQRGHVVALALNGSFGPALDALGKADKLKSTDLLDKTIFDLFLLTLEFSSDFEFARYGGHLMQQVSGTLPKSVARQSAERFLSVGLTSYAQQALSITPSSSTSDEDRILQARIHLSMRAPHQAMISLLGIDTSEADFLRAEAINQKFDYATAASVYENSGSAEDAGRAYYMAGDLDSLEALQLDEDSVYRKLANTERELEGLAVTSTADDSLGSAVDLLSEAEETRNHIDNLLSTE